MQSKTITCAPRGVFDLHQCKSLEQAQLKMNAIPPVIPPVTKCVVPDMGAKEENRVFWCIWRKPGGGRFA